MTLDRRRFLIATGAAGLVAAARPTDALARAQAWETVIDTNTLTSYAALESAWNYQYPWGSDHNGTARMYASSTDHNHVYLEPGGILVLKAARITWDEGNSSKDPYLPIHYHSGAIHSKLQLVINDQFPNWEVKGEFQAPSTRGTWPAFWLTGANSWPPESDILEFKGDSRNWFNTYDGAWENTTVQLPSPGTWNRYRAWISKVSATDVTIDYYLNDQWIGRHRGSNFVGKPMYIIVNLQMEGSSGAPGPSSDTFYRARNIYVGRSNTAS